MEAAVVNPRTVPSLLRMVPAPRKPIPVMMPCITRVGSTETPSIPNSVIHSDACQPNSINSALAMHTSACVRNPAGRE